MIKADKAKNDWWAKSLSIGLLLILGLLPLHAVLSTWAISNFGLEALFKSWKEIILLLLLVPSLIIVWRDDSILLKLMKRPVNQLILAYALLHILLIAWLKPDTKAAIVALVINLRFLAIFVLAQLAVMLSPGKKLRQVALKLIMAGVVLVVGFGLLQATVLPNDVLKHVGYGQSTILPYQTIDQNSDFVRINSTLRGPNPLGLYMILAMSLLSGWWLVRAQASKLKTKYTGSRWLPSVLIVASLITLYASQSRSGWLGTVTATGLIVWWQRPAWRKLILIGVSSALIIGTLIFIFFGQSRFIQNVVWHSNPSSNQAIDSSEAHWQASRRAAEDIATKPLGEGPGTAGPASFYATKARISENYFLQIGQETGILGLGLFIGILWLSGKELYKRGSGQIMPQVLLASLIGLSIASLFLHVWANDVIALTWWGLAGLWLYDS